MSATARGLLPDLRGLADPAAESLVAGSCACRNGEEAACATLILLAPVRWADPVLELVWMAATREWASGRIGSMPNVTHLLRGNAMWRAAGGSRVLATLSWTDDVCEVHLAAMRIKACDRRRRAAGLDW